MEIETKDAVTVGGWLISLGGAFTWFKVGLANLKKRVARLENNLHNEKGETLLLSKTEHTSLCAKQQKIHDENKGHLKELDDKMTEVREIVIRLDERLKGD